ncbi:MAG: hypothetical protein COB59_00560 [Rhodospirillaceae bacterium]|nr:MAG: hypothetical protein COB59_00560 [Rhodospirillaceae bacterium]
MKKTPPTVVSGRFSESIRSRLMIWFAVAAVGAVLPGAAVVYFAGLERIQEDLKQNFCQIAERSAHNFENQILNEFQFIQEISNDTQTARIFHERQRRYESESAYIGAGEKDVLYPTTNKISDIHIGLSFRLQVYQGLRSSIMTHLSLYDRGGNLVGDSDRKKAIGRDDRVWYDDVKAHNNYFRYINVDTTTSKLILVTAVLEGLDIVGYALGEYNLKAMDERTLQTQKAHFGKTGRAFMLDANGKMLLGEVVAGQSSNVSDDILKIMPKEKGFAPIISRSFFMKQIWSPFSTRKQVACLAPLDELNQVFVEYGFPSWGVVVTQSPEESYATLFGSIRNFVFVGFIGALGAALLGISMAWRITAPLKHLERGVQRFAIGERDFQVDADENDEVGDLVREFNHMAQRVEASEQKLKAFAMAVENSADAIVMVRPTGIIYYTNPAFEKVTGYSSAEAVGKKPSILRVESTPDETYQALWKSIAAKKPWCGELHNRRKNGEVYPVELTVSPVLDEHDEIVSVLGIHRDITLAREYRENLEREVEERSRQIVETQGLTTVGRMASMIAHDLRNALTTVKMNLQILARRHEATEDIEHQYCNIGLGQVRYMEDFLTDMLSFARPSNLQCEWHDLNEILDEVMSAVSLSALEKEVEVALDVDMFLPRAFCDRNKIVAVLRNIFDNAFLAMPDGGKVLAVTEVFEPKEQNGQMYILVSVTDTGTGIEEENLASVFDPFFTTRVKGTGLGLAIVKRAIEQHRGEITVRSTVGEGTTFSFTLPVNDKNNSTQG